VQVVVTWAAEHDVVTGFLVTEVQGVLPQPTEQKIVTVHTSDEVRSPPTRHPVIPCPAVDDVAAPIPADEIVAVASEDDLASTKPYDDIGSSRAIDSFDSGLPNDGRPLAEAGRSRTGRNTRHTEHQQGEGETGNLREPNGPMQRCSDYTDHQTPLERRSRTLIVLALARVVTTAVSERIVNYHEYLLHLRRISLRTNLAPGHWATPIHPPWVTSLLYSVYVYGLSRISVSGTSGFMPLFHSSAPSWDCR
jgi:hypothetical protein